MRIRQGKEVMWLEVTPDMRIPFTKVRFSLHVNTILYDEGGLTCSLWKEDARTFNMLYKEFTSRTSGG